MKNGLAVLNPRISGKSNVANQVPPLLMPWNILDCITTQKSGRVNIYLLDN